MGIIESYQSNGQNVNIYPEVSGRIVEIFVAEGDVVSKDAPLFAIDDSIQRAVVEQQRAQAEAAKAAYEALKAQPRKEVLAVARAQVELASANRKTTLGQFEKQRRSFELDPRSVSQDVLDSSFNSFEVSDANFELAKRQFELTRAGAWIYDIRNQQKQHESSFRAFVAAEALLSKYVVRAPVDGVVLSVQPTVGNYVSPQGSYDPYTQSFVPVLRMGSERGFLAVRCYLDEILIPRLPPPERIRATMIVRGTNLSVPLEFVRVQPYVQPKIQLSNQRAERVDVRVLPIVFRFRPTMSTPIFPGALVDVYVGST